MGESQRRRSRASKTFKEHLFLNSKLSKFGRCIVALEPDKPGPWLAERAQISERNANQIIRGDRKVPARALVILMDEVD